MNEVPSTPTIRELLDNVQKESYVIPHFQRSFNWEPGMVCDLIESVFQKYYAGLIMGWKLSQAHAKEEGWDPLWGVPKTDKVPSVAILDGQQRLSSLYYAFCNPNKTFPRKKSYYVFTVDLIKILNCDYDDSVDFFYYGSYQSWDTQRAKKDKWAESGILPLTILYAKDPSEPSRAYIDSDEFQDWYKEFELHHIDNIPNGTKFMDARNRINDILNYTFVYYSLSEERSTRDICNIFARVNAKGLKLSTFDLMNAFLYPYDIKLRKELWDNIKYDVFKDIHPKMGEYILKVISLHLQNYCSSKYIFYLIPGQVTVQRDEFNKNVDVVLIDNGIEFIQLWNKATKYMEEARKIIMNTGKFDAGAVKPDFIPNTTILPVVAAILWELESHVKPHNFDKSLIKWVWAAALSEEYSGSSDTVMSKDFRDWKSWFDQKPIERMNTINEEYVDRIDFSDIKKGSARYNTIICMLSLNKAEDFYTMRIVGSVDYQAEKINDHHIFPAEVKLPNLNSRFTKTKDSIVNRTLLFDETNKIILNKKPSVYVDDMLSKHSYQELIALMQRHLINENALEFMRNDDYDNFIVEREKEIKLHIKRQLFD